MNIRLDVASRLLSSLINQDGDRSMDACISNVIYCIDLTDLLIEKCSEPAKVAAEIPPAASSPTWTSDEAIKRVAIKNAKAAFAERVERRQLVRDSRPRGETPRQTLH